MLDQNAKYTISIKALEKWSDERLKLKISDEGTIEGKFRYEGTTCSNLGHKLEFQYDIKLSSAIEGYQIISLNCNPSDEGYKYMCGYLKDSEQLLSEIRNEKPLLGRNLQEVLKWERQFSPEGCYCNHESRRHKWGIVFEVMHYAVAKYEKQKMNVRPSSQTILEN